MQIITMTEIFIKVGLANLQILSPKKTLQAFKKMSSETKKQNKTKKVLVSKLKRTFKMKTKT